MRRYRIIFCLILLGMQLWFMKGIVVDACSVKNQSFLSFGLSNTLSAVGYIDGSSTEMITMSPDGKAFTTNSGDKNTKWYPYGYEVNTGVQSTLRTPVWGEHIYSVEKKGNVSVSKWVVCLEQSTCRHNGYTEGNMFHGVPVGSSNCFKPYYSGWFGYCADCNEKIVNYFFYMSDTVAMNLKSIDMSKSYFYLCPHCNSLEQGVVLSHHMCKALSANRYYVRYHANFGSGTMEKSVHMVNNSCWYEGCEVTPQTTLNQNKFTRDGYVFTGWNTQKDGSGTYFKDGATIYNLSMEENSSVVLYAQWEKRSSVLEIDPNGGSYGGKKKGIRIQQSYGSEYKVDSSVLVPPDGFRVHFHTMGGEPISDMVGKQSFREWKLSQPFHGKYENDKYYFRAPDGCVDRLTAEYTLLPITLPGATKENYSFGGWYEDKECTIPVGTAGSQLIPGREMTLYACWVELQLLSQDNYKAHQGKGAVDLSWRQQDKQNKTYEVFQKRDGQDWMKISSEDGKTKEFEVAKIIEFSQKDGSYTIPYTGFYDLVLTGAQGENYGAHSGGKGGQVKATVYLVKGEKLEYQIGGQNGFGGGGKGTVYGSGGGYSIVSTNRLGIIMIAGGGGGASEYKNGKSGGTSVQVTEDSRKGQMGQSGGGGGYAGGVHGEVERHTHTKQCVHVHTGSPLLYGGCYQTAAQCGCKNIEFQIKDTTFSYGNVSEDGRKQYCKRCESYECVGHLDVHGVYICEYCGNETDYEVTQCKAQSIYGLSCKQENQYVCGLKEGEVINIIPAYGGSSFVNTKACITHKEKKGVQEGNGKLQIASNQVGMLEMNEMKGLSAKDLASPKAIDKDSIKLTAVKEDQIRVTFAKPTDDGTIYYHQVKSYDKKTKNYISESNITKNELISQVAGYRYIVDESKNTKVKSKHAFYGETGERPFLIVKRENEVQYLHIAAVDKAGNIGPTTHVKLKGIETVYRPVITEKLQIKEGENVTLSEERDVYYVKADDNTPVELSLEGLLCGTAGWDYQINEARFEMKSMTSSSIDGALSINVPFKQPIMAGTFTYPIAYLRKQLSGVVRIRDAEYTIAKRYNMCCNLWVTQHFLIPQELDGEKIRVTPRVQILFGHDRVSSNEQDDLFHSIYIIADGTAPNISGTEAIDKAGKVSFEEGETLDVVLSAEDSGSGLGQFYVKVENYDNGLVTIYEDEELTGKISFCVQESDKVFNGKFSITAYAKDKVGNVSVIQSELLGVGLQAYVERVLEPHEPKFKKGESGVLYITTWGYVERLEVSFPDSFVKEDPTLNKIILYKTPRNLQMEEIPFMVPLTTSDEKMTIQVKAYKSGTTLEKEPQMITIEVKGTVLDEIRTRLR